MLSIVIDGGVDEYVVKPLLARFERFGIHTEVWEHPEPMPMGTDAVVTHSERFLRVKNYTAESHQDPRIIVLSDGMTAEETRRMLNGGAAANVPLAGRGPNAHVFAIVAAASGAVAGVPPDHAAEISSRLEEPPRSLSPEEAYLLGLVASRTVEAAGTVLGLSRRQAQRRVRALCDELGLANHHMASIKAARWGLVDREGQPTVVPGDVLGI